MNDISSPRCFVLFEKLSPVGSSLKTFAACLVSNLDGYSPRLSHHWKAKVSKSSHFVFLLQPSKPLTGEIDCGLLPTVATSWFERGQISPEAWEARQAKRRAEGKAEFAAPLHVRISEAQMLGTPTAKITDRKPETLAKSMAFRKSQGDWNTVPLYLAEQIGMLRTPDANMERGDRSTEKMQSRLDRGMPLNLNDQINAMNKGLLPTPATRDYKGANSAEHLAKERGHHDQLPNAIAMHGENHGLKLQPGFVEWMMGYPIGYTDLKPSETA